MMPYLIRHSKSKKTGYEVVRRDTGEVVAHAKSLKGARGYVWHASEGERSAKPKGKKK